MLSDETGEAIDEAAEATEEAWDEATETDSCAVKLHCNPVVLTTVKSTPMAK